MTEFAPRPDSSLPRPRFGRAWAVAAGFGGGLAGLALLNAWLSVRAERLRPPVGQIAAFDGVALHWVDLRPEGPETGPPVVLLHGNLVTLDDWIASGVADRLVASGRRVLAFDRPGFGYSARPAGRWGAREQAALLRSAAATLGVERPLVVGHSWGSLVALAWAQDATVAGVALVSGYHYASRRVDALLVAPAAAPGIGPLLRHTLAPPFARATLPRVLRSLFAPRPVPAAFEAAFPQELVPRPSQLRATARDGAMMVDEARRLGRRMGRLRAPVAVMTGTADGVVEPDDQSGRLARELGARLISVREAGHMVHHAAPDRLVAATLSLDAAAGTDARPEARRRGRAGARRPGADASRPRPELAPDQAS
jgi:pimeloyl-ACP methyl ester carboxylesterase